MTISDQISINEALVSLIAERDDADGSNAIALYRNAQANILKAHGLGSSGAAQFLAKRRDQDQVDDLIILASRNGSVDLFS